MLLLLSPLLLLLLLLLPLRPLLLPYGLCRSPVHSAALDALQLRGGRLLLPGRGSSTSSSSTSCRSIRRVPPDFSRGRYG